MTQKEGSPLTQVFGLDVIRSGRAHRENVRGVEKVGMITNLAVWACPLEMACRKAWSGNHITGEGIGAVY